MDIIRTKTQILFGLIAMFIFLRILLHYGFLAEGEALGMPLTLFFFLFCNLILTFLGWAAYVQLFQPVASRMVQWEKTLQEGGRQVD